MDTERVTRELRGYLESLHKEYEQLSARIIKTQAMLAELGEPVKRGPGRPKGSGLKRGPGRPRKNPLPVDAAAEDAPVRRGPGRPKGSGTKRGPGRPKGSGVKTEDAESKPSGRAPMSEEAREAARLRMQEYWARRKGLVPGAPSSSTSASEG